MDLNQLAEEIGEWHKGKFPGKTLHEIALKLGEESGEVQGALVKWGEAQRGERVDGVDWNENFQEELGHVLHVVLTLAYYTGASIEDILESTWAKTSKRSWV